MPRKTIDLPYRVEYLSILDENGQLDADLDPHLDDELAMKLHRAMLLGRRFDERMLSLQRQGRIGTFAPIKGQEASNVGAVAALRETDWMAPSFRETAGLLWRGFTMEGILAYFGGYDEAGRIPDESRTLPVSIPVGSQLLHAVGIGMAARYRHTDEVAMTFFGDGATSEGDFHEALNWAGVFQVPVVFVCQNNHWAISIPRSRQSRSETLAQKALAYGIPGLQVDGNDILAVYSAVHEAVERARSGGGPTLIEAVTYRLAMHTTADDPKRYRTEEEVESWNKKDPLVRFEKYLIDRGLLTQEKLAVLEDEVRAEIQGAVERAEQMMSAPVDPVKMFEHTYETIPPSVAEERDELQRDWAAAAGKEG